MTYILGFCGPAKVGKTTTSNALVDIFKTKYPDVKIGSTSFAAPLYDIVSYITKIPVDKLQDQSYKEVPWTESTSPIPGLLGWTPRKLLQIVGTECFRSNVHNDFWIQLAHKNCEQYDIAIIADCRFENELNMLDCAIELHREHIDYAKNHPSAMPPKQELIDRHLTLYKNINLESLCDDIYNEYKRKSYNGL